MGHHSSSDSEYSRESSSSRRKKKSRRKRQSSSPSSDHHRSSKHSKSSRIGSPSSSRESGSSSRRRKRSRSRDRSRRSRSRSPGRRASKRSRSRDRSRERSEKKFRARSPSPPRRKKHVDAVLGVSTGTLKDVLDIVPGFSKMTPAEQSKIRIQRELQAAVDSLKNEPNSDDEGEENSKTSPEPHLDVRAQIERANAIQAYADSDDDDDGEAPFLPTHFKSSAKLKKKLADAASKKADPKTTFVEREGTHELAIFGHTSTLSMDQVLKMKKDADEEALSKAKRRVDFCQRDPDTLFAEELLVSTEEANARWTDKLCRLRSKFFGDAADHAP